MKDIFVKSTTAKGYFFRCGHRWTDDGELIDRADWSEDQLRTLSQEPNLHMREATAEEMAEAETADTTGDGAGLGDQEAAIDEVMRVIPLLPADAFSKQKLPKLDAIRAEVQIDDAMVTADVRDIALDRLIKGGFIVPAVPAT